MLIIEINRLVKRAFDVAGREISSRRGDSSGDENMLSVTLTCRREHGGKVVLQNALNINNKKTVITEAGGGEKEYT